MRTGGCLKRRQVASLKNREIAIIFAPAPGINICSSATPSIFSFPCHYFTTLPHNLTSTNIYSYHLIPNSSPSPTVTTPNPQTTSRLRSSPSPTSQNGCRSIMRKLSPPSPSPSHLPLLTNPPLTLPLKQVKAIFQTIGACLMAIVNGIGAVLQAIIGGIVALFDIIISCLTCGRGGGHRRGGRSAV